MLTDHDRCAILVDATYAARQLRQHGDVRRALDAIARIQEVCRESEPTNWSDAQLILRQEG